MRLSFLIFQFEYVDFHPEYEDFTRLSNTRNALSKCVANQSEAPVKIGFTAFEKPLHT